jgi:serine/threonine protein phosphatase PrpC
MSLLVQIAQRSSAGPKSKNDDAVCIHMPSGSGRASRSMIATIADGVSVARHGDEAAAIAAHSFCSDFFATDPHWSIQTAGYRVIEGIHRWLAGQSQHYLYEAHNSHLTTFSTVIVQGESAYVFHVGDSRVWRLREGQLEPLTSDHVIRGMGSNQLTRALGMEGRIDVDFRQVDVKAGDRFLLTTDGIHGFVPNNKLVGLISGDNLEDCLDALFDMAQARESNDNQSAQLIQIDQIDPDLHETQPNYHLPPLPDLLTEGQRVDGYTIVRELHANARSTVYQAIRESDGVQVVLKAPSPQLAQDHDALQAFMREDWIGQRIDHPDVVRTFSPDPDRKFLYLIQEYLSGCNLRVWRQNHPEAPVQTVIGLARPVVRALRALHRRETLHQDIKPDNLILLDDGRVKLIDLGSARVGSIHDERARPGAYEYAAPEYVLGQPIDGRADQFALAVSFYELLTGAFPYGPHYVDASTTSDFNQLFYTPASQYNPHVPAWMDAALMRASHLDANLRYADLGEFMADLERPNPDLSRPRQPLIERSPVRFWQTVSVLLLLGHLVWLMIWFRP